MEEIVRERPSDLPDFSLNYMNKLIRNYPTILEKRKQINPPSDSENSSN